MTQKLLSALNLIKSLALKIYSAAPLLSGIVIGYVFKPELKLILDAGLDLAKKLLKL